MASNIWEDRIRSILGGVTLDPKAKALPGEGALPYTGRRIKEAAVDAYAPIREGVVRPLNSFLFGQAPVETPNMPTVSGGSGLQVKTPSAPITAVTRPEGIASIQPNTGMVQTAPLTEKERIAGIAGRVSPENPYGANVVGGNIRTNQIRGGAASDEEATRNLQDRALQDQATQAEVARLNRATDALRSLREERSPAFRFGVDSIGGGPDKLDVASGRVINRDTPANVVADRMTSAVDTARRFGAGGRAGREIAKQMGDAYTADKELQGFEAQLAAKGTGINPVDMGRFLLDQQKFSQQQGIDKSNLQLREMELKNKEAGTSLEQQKYLDTQRKAFTDNFTFSDQNAPREQIGADVFEMSRVSGIPPETVAAAYEQTVKDLGIDWGKGGPKSQKALSEEVMKRLARERGGK